MISKIVVRWGNNYPDHLFHGARRLLHRKAARPSLDGRAYIRFRDRAIGGVARSERARGRIEAVRVVVGLLPDDALSPDPAKWKAPALVTWNAKIGPADQFAWASVETAPTATDPRKGALADLCHVLLNANEFLYLQ